MKVKGGIAILIVCHAAAFAGTDPFLLLSAPSFSSNQVEFTLTGEASVLYVIESSADLQNWFPIATNTSPEIVRPIALEASNDSAFYRAWRAPLPVFAGALLARSNITFNGNNVRVDSYDSADPNHSTPTGLYDPTKAKAGGDVASAEGFIGVGNANIKGKLLTGPVNTGQYSIGSGGSVGDLAWVGPGVQPGWYDDHFRFALPDVAPPFQTGLPPSSQGTNLWLLGSFNYLYSGNLSVSSSHTIYVAGHASVYVTGSADIKGRINIAPGASLKLYVGGASTVLNGVNTEGSIYSFQYFGLPTNEAIHWGGNEAYVGIVYAPQASLSLSGGGINPYDYEGSCVVESVSINGHFNFHYDENLKVNGPKR